MKITYAAEQKTHLNTMNKHNKKTDYSRRKLIALGTTAALSPVWAKPVINSVILPAHAQTSMNMCTTDITVGGPLAGNASGATSCQAACEAEATSLSGQLCEVRETTTATGTDCSCDIDI